MSGTMKNIPRDLGDPITDIDTIKDTDVVYLKQIKVNAVAQGTVSSPIYTYVPVSIKSKPVDTLGNKWASIKDKFSPPQSGVIASYGPTGIIDKKDAILFKITSSTPPSPIATVTPDPTFKPTPSKPIPLPPKSSAPTSPKSTPPAPTPPAPTPPPSKSSAPTPSTTPESTPSTDKPSNATPSKKRKGPTIPLAIYSTNFDVEKDVETGNLTETQKEIADILELDTFADRVRGEALKDEYIADVLRNVISGCTSDGIITLGPHCPKINHYLAALSLLILQEGPLRGAKPAPKAEDMYGDVTVKIIIPISKLIELLGLNVKAPSPANVDQLRELLQELKTLIEQYNKAQSGGGGEIPLTKSELKEKIDALIKQVNEKVKELGETAPPELVEEIKSVVESTNTIFEGATTVVEDAVQKPTESSVDKAQAIGEAKTQVSVDEPLKQAIEEAKQITKSLNDAQVPPIEESKEQVPPIEESKEQVPPIEESKEQVPPTSVIESLKQVTAEANKITASLNDAVRTASTTPSISPEEALKAAIDAAEAITAELNEKSKL